MKRVMWILCFFINAASSLLNAVSLSYGFRWEALLLGLFNVTFMLVSAKMVDLIAGEEAKTQP